MKRLLLIFVGLFALSSASAQFTAPITESFDGTSLPTSWSTSSTTGGPWLFTGSTNSVNCSPAPDHTGNAGNYTWMDQSGSDAGVLLEMPDVNVGSLTTPYLEFYYWMCGVGYSPINKTYIETFDGTSWSVLDSITTATAGWQYFGYDLTGLTHGTNLVRVRFRAESGGSTSDFYGDNALDDISIIEAPTCQIPTGLTANKETTSGATLNWSAVSNAVNGYEVIYGTTGFDPATSGTSTTTSADSLVIVGLSGATTFDAYIIADCGAADGISDTSAPVSFTTLCVPYTAPYTTDFDSDTDGDVALCWAQYSSYTGGYARVENLGTPRSGSQQLALYSSSGGAGDTLISISPQFSDMTASDKQVRFFAKTTDATNALIVGTVSGQTVGASFSPLDTITFTAANSYQEIVVGLSAANGYNGNDEYVGFVHSLGSTFEYIYIDDFNYEVAPPCAKLTGTTFLNVGTNSVDVSFSGTPTNIQYEFGPVGFTQGTGTTSSLTGPPFTITGMNSATCYDVYVRNDCSGAGNGTSTWSGPFTVCTACNVVSLPYNENFDLGLGCFNVVDGGDSPDSWQHTPAGGNGNYSGDIDGTGHVSADSDGAGNGPTMVEELISPYIDASGLAGNLFLEFDQFYDHLGSEARVDVWDGAQWVNLLTQNSADVGSFVSPDHQKIDITAYANDSLQVRFVYDDLGSWAWWWLVDNFSVNEVLCSQSTNVSSFYRSTDTIGITWSPGSGSNFTVEYGPTGFSVGSGQTTTTTNDSVFIGGLSTGTSYDFYIIDSCAGGQASTPSGPHTFSTSLCVPSQSCVFTVDLSDSFGDGWNGAEISFVQNGITVATIGSNFTGGSSLNGVQVTLCDGLSTDVVLSSAGTFPGEIGFTVTSPFPNQVGSHSPAPVSQGDILASFTASCALPSCPQPANVTTASIGDTSATLQWGSVSASNSYEVWVGPAGFYQGTTTVGGFKAITTNTNLLIDTLTPQGCYEFLVRAICGPGDSSVWVGPITFCTACAPFSATYSESFNTMTTGQEPDCWTAVLVGANTQFSDAYVESFGVPRTPPNHINFYNYNNTTTMLVTPYFSDIGAGDKRVTMYARQGNGAGELVIIGTVPSPGNYQQFAPLDTFIMGSADQKMICNLTTANGYNGTDQYIAFQHGNTASFNTLYMDDFVYEVIPSCPEPLQGVTLNTSDVSADLQFTGGGAANFNIAYGAPGFTPGPNAPNYISVTSTTPTLTGLTPNTQYEWYVRDSCAVGDVSIWVGPFSFQTICAPISAPFFDDFENGTLGYYQGLDNCWNLVNTVNKTSPTSGYGWELRNTSQTSSGTSTGPDRDNTLAPAQGGKFFNADVSYGSSGDSSMLISPIIDLTPLNTPELEYHVHRYGTGMAEFYVDIYDGTQWVNGVHSYTSSTGAQTSQSDPFTDSIIDLTPYASVTNFQVRFRTVSNGCCAGDNGLDDIRISDPISGDLDLVEGEFIKGLCLSANDSIKLQVVNTVNTTVDFAVNPLAGAYSVTGPANSSGNISVTSGTLPAFDTLDIFIGGIDLSIPGSYSLDAYIDTSFINIFRNRDTLSGITVNVDAEFEVDPKTVTLASQNDSVEICVNSSFFGSGNFFISEVSHFGATTGQPVGGWPAYLPDDYLEITGVPGSDLDGYTLEQWENGGLDGSFTFGPGTIIGPDGTATIAIGSGNTSDPSNFLYDGRGSAGTWGSAGASGKILKDASGAIVDAVGYPGSGGYTFPAASGVTASDWSGSIPASTSTGGVRLTGADNNSATNWVVSSGTNPQDPNVLNPNVPLPQAASAPGLTWTQVGSTTVIDTTSCIVVGPYSSSGTFQYVASFSNPCGSYSDTVTVLVPNCSAPASISGGTVSANSVGVAFDTTGTNATNFDIEYGSAGFMIGTGTRVSTTMDSMVVTGLANNVCQDFYVRANCGGADTSAWIGPVNLCPEESICTDDMEPYATGLMEGQSALFLPWQATAGAGGSASIVTSQSASGSQSLRLSNPTGAAGDHDDLVAYFDTISSGAWEISFEMFIPINHNGYFNIQQNHAYTSGTNLWGAEIYFNGSGLAEVLYSTGQVSVGTFSYNHGTWNTMSTFIDLDNDSIWFEFNGTTTGLGYAYSLANPGQPLQFNGVNFFTGVQTGDNTTSEFYIDDFCVSPASLPNVCNPPTGVAATSNVGCDSIEVNFNSNTGSSVIEYGPAPLTPGAGTFTGVVTAPYTITGLTANTSYDIRVADTCGTDTSNYASITTSTANSPQPVASFTVDSAIVGGAYEVYVNASASTGATTYSWTYGNGNSGSGVTDTNAYSSNGSYTITLIVTNNCGSDTATFTTNANVGIDEDALSRSLTVYPNPANDVVNISFSEVGSADVSIVLSDAQGRTVLNLSDKLQSGVYTRGIDVSNLAAGIYLLEITSGELNAQRRISVRK